jgi:allophanate hydrolase
LGTDTAGSGRVPAMFNNLIGLKPTRGILSTRGVVPACRTLDCVSIFAETTSDASIILSVARGFDELDPYSRIPSFSSGASPWIVAPTFRFAIPTLETREFFGDVHNPVLFQNAIDVIKRDLGGEPVEFDLTPFLDVASLLYKGPWVAERYAAIGHFIDQHASGTDPIVRAIVTKAKDYSAADAFNAAYELERLKKKTNPLWEKFDIILVPTAPRTYTLDEIAAAPIERNSHLGYYTNFVNLLDLAAIAVPAGIRPDGLPFGVTLISHAFTDNALLLLADRIHRSLSANIGGSTRSLANTPKLVSIPSANMPMNCFLLAVVGAHLSGQPLNYQLTERKGRLVRTCRTDHEYRLYALKNSVPAKPGLVRVTGSQGPGIELEIWALPSDSVASFIQMIPPPLCIGNIYLEDGQVVKGFLVEPSALDTAQDITHMGGWRAYLNSTKSSA